MLEIFTVLCCSFHMSLILFDFLTLVQETQRPNPIDLISLMLPTLEQHLPLV